MSKRQAFNTDEAPRAKLPYSQAIIHNDILYVSGQGPFDPTSGAFIRGSIEEETRATLRILKIIIEEAGFDLDGVLKTTCYLANMDDFAGFNKAYAECFAQAPPARTTIQAGRLFKDMKVEIDAIVGLI
jgi:2-iminobutanoate/2-iminopropanoate deaminase